MSSTQTIITIAIIIALLAFRIYRQTREQRWSIRSMWVAPAVFALLTIVIVGFDTTQVHLAPLAAVAGLAAGVWVGLYQGTHTTVRVDKPNKAVFIKVSPVGIVIFMAILVVRIGLRVATVGPVTQSAALGGNAIPPISPLEAMLSSGLLALAVGSLLGLRWYVQKSYDSIPAAAQPGTGA